MMGAIMGLDASSSSSSDDGSSSSSNADLDPWVMIIMISMPTPCLIERWMQHPRCDDLDPFAGAPALLPPPRPEADAAPAVYDSDDTDPFADDDGSDLLPHSEADAATAPPPPTQQQDEQQQQEDLLPQQEQQQHWICSCGFQFNSADSDACAACDTPRPAARSLPGNEADCAALGPATDHEVVAMAETGGEKKVEKVVKRPYNEWDKWCVR